MNLDRTTDYFICNLFDLLLSHILYFFSVILSELRCLSGFPFFKKRMKNNPMDTHSAYPSQKNQALQSTMFKSAENRAMYK